MRPGYLVGIIIGILLVYLSFYGLAGFGLSWTSSSLPMREDFNELGEWGTYIAGGATNPTINPAGQVQLQAGSGTGDTRCSITSVYPASACTNVLQYTINASIQGNWTATHGSLEIGFRAADSSGFWEARINGSYMYALSSGSSSPWAVPVAGDALFHTYTFCVSVASNQASISVYRDLALVKSGALGSTSTVWQSQISIDASDAVLVHIDYISFASGLNPPAAQTASLTVNTNYLSGSNTLPLDGIAVTVGSATQNTVSGSTTFSGLAVGSISVGVQSPYSSGTNTYTFSSWSDGGAITHPVNLLSGGLTLTATYTVTIQPTTGSLRVFATYQGTTYVAVLMTVSGPTPGSGLTTTDPNNPLLLSNLQAGFYTISGTYNTILGSNTVQVQASDTPAQVTVNFAAIQPTTGNLTIVAYYQGSLVVASVSITGPQSSSGSTSMDSNHPLVFPSLAPGTYHVTGTFTGSSEPQTADPVVSAGQNSYVTLTFQSTTPPVDIIGQLIAWLRTQLDKPIVREGELGIGGLLTFVSVIGFFWPGPKKQIQYVMAPPR